MLQIIFYLNSMLLANHKKLKNKKVLKGKFNNINRCLLKQLIILNCQRSLKIQGY